MDQQGGKKTQGNYDLLKNALILQPTRAERPLRQENHIFSRTFQEAAMDLGLCRWFSEGEIIGTGDAQACIWGSGPSSEETCLSENFIFLKKVYILSAPLVGILNISDKCISQKLFCVYLSSRQILQLLLSFNFTYTFYRMYM